jgi:hypothetical protein
MGYAYNNITHILHICACTLLLPPLHFLEKMIDKDHWTPTCTYASAFCGRCYKQKRDLLLLRPTIDGLCVTLCPVRAHNSKDTEKRRKRNRHMSIYIYCTTICKIYISICACIYIYRKEVVEVL